MERMPAYPSSLNFVRWWPGQKERPVTFLLSVFCWSLSSQAPNHALHLRVQEKSSVLSSSWLILLWPDQLKIRDSSETLLYYRYYLTKNIVLSNIAPGHTLCTRIPHWLWRHFRDVFYCLLENVFHHFPYIFVKLV